MKTNRDWRIESGGATARSALGGAHAPRVHCSTPSRNRGRRSHTTLLNHKCEPHPDRRGRRPTHARVRVLPKRNRIVTIPVPARTNVCQSAHTHFPLLSTGREGTLCGVMFVVLLIFSAVCTHAQSYSIDWFTIGGGGGTSTGGVYSISGTIGQPDAGVMSGGNYSLAGGFWGFIGAVQIPNGLLLTIRRTQTNSVLVSWPSPSTGFSLQEATDLTTPTWNPPSESITDNGTNKFIIVNPPTENRFYRLFKP
jgi:hypothetical protein